SLHAHRQWWTNFKVALSASSPKGVSALRKTWCRSWIGRVGWPWLRREFEVVLKVSGVVVLSLWAKRLVEQVLCARIVNERILQGELDGLVHEIEQDVAERRSHGHRRSK